MTALIAWERRCCRLSAARFSLPLIFRVRVDFAPGACHTVFTFAKLGWKNKRSQTRPALFLCLTEPFPPPAASFFVMTHAWTISWSLSAAKTDAAGQTREGREEALWVARAKTGDEAACRRLLEQHRSRVVRLAAHILRRSDEAEDAAQEAFVRAFQRLPEFRGTGPFASWLCSITVRVCLDRRRAARWQRETPESAAPEAASSASSPDARLLIEALLDRLSPPMRAALVLREVEGLEYDEIAQILQIPVGTVRSRLHAARAQFRQLWTAVDEESSHV